RQVRRARRLDAPAKGRRSGVLHLAGRRRRLPPSCLPPSAVERPLLVSGPEAAGCGTERGRGVCDAVASNRTSANAHAGAMLAIIFSPAPLAEAGFCPVTRLPSAML